jgi:hypothetical protein
VVEEAVRELEVLIREAMVVQVVDVEEIELVQHPDRELAIKDSAVELRQLDLVQLAAEEQVRLEQTLQQLRQQLEEMA